ncbi:MAG TPA: 50S ribosomal protein L15 [Gammaproteobacteria bacterium]|jgi:large subunit ribosomal protein L15|nr:50S ribosomal protein L15 [Gammaproteobacteria bacterium]
MRLNDLRPAAGSKSDHKRRGRGGGSGLGKTGGRGVKGQRARAGGYHKVGFEGGQMPIQRRLPKIGFVSPTRALSGEVRVHELARLAGKTADLAALKAAHLVSKQVELARVIASGKLDKAVTVGGPGVRVTAGARKIIEAAGGKVVE